MRPLADAFLTRRVLPLQLAVSFAAAQELLGDAMPATGGGVAGLQASIQPVSAQLT